MMSQYPAGTVASNARAQRPRDVALNRVDHMVVGVHDLSSADAWYRDALGLTVLDRSESRVALSCDGSHTHLILEASGPGLRSFAIGASDSAALARVATLADAAGLEVQAESTPDRPGITDLIRVQLEGNQTLEVVTRADSAAGTVIDEWTPGRLEPLGIDHVGIASLDPSNTVDHLAGALPFSISEKVIVGGEQCLAAFARTSNYHHDVSVILTAVPTNTLHHYAFTVGGMEQFAVIADRLADRGTPIEHGPLRHGDPSYNLAMYTRDPDGNRIEFTAQMKTIPWDNETHVTDDEQAASAVNYWRPGYAPETFFPTGT